MAWLLWHQALGPNPRIYLMHHIDISVAWMHHIDVPVPELLNNCHSVARHRWIDGLGRQCGCGVGGSVGYGVCLWWLWWLWRLSVALDSDTGGWRQIIEWHGTDGKVPKITSKRVENTGAKILSLWRWCARWWW